MHVCVSVCVCVPPHALVAHLQLHSRVVQQWYSNSSSSLWHRVDPMCIWTAHLSFPLTHPKSTPATQLRYDMCLGSFDRALQLADDSSAADVWYNLSQVCRRMYMCV